MVMPHPPKGNPGQSLVSALSGRALALFFLLLIAGSGASCRDAADYAPLVAGSWERSAAENGFSFRGSLEMRPDGTFSFTFEGTAPGHSDSHGKWSLAGRDMTFLDSSCVDPGTYRFLVKKETLSFLPLKDDCEPRKNALTGEWTRIKFESGDG
ncbi:MAG: hypothetical protein IT344_08000 [Candidatus Dadabacteria bacterium]|nr:hypothetical protein [Candidatus Dadabacteria bacterium]